METILAVVTLVISFGLVLKYIKTSDISILGTVIPRIILSCFLLFPKEFNPIFTIINLVLLVFVSDLIITIVSWFGKRSVKYKNERETVRALLSIETRYKALVENNVVGIFVIDCKGNIIYLNDIATTLLGVGEDEKVNFYNLLYQGEQMHVSVKKCASGNATNISLKSRAVFTNKSLNIFGKTSVNGMTTITGIIVECCPEV